MKRKIIIYVFLLYTNLVEGQSITPGIIASSGNYYGSSSLHVSYTIGEMALVHTVIASGDTVTQGFHQPGELMTTLTNELAISDVKTAIYPNPAANAFYTGFHLLYKSHVRVELLDMSGKLLTMLRDETCNPGTHIFRHDINHFPSGIYLVNFVVTCPNTPQHSTSKKLTINH